MLLFFPLSFNLVKFCLDVIIIIFLIFCFLFFLFLIWSVCMFIGGQTVQEKWEKIGAAKQL